MIALATAVLFAATAPCEGTLDRTPDCAAPAQTALVVTDDIKTTPPPPARDPSKLAGELGFVGLATGALGGAALAASLVEWTSTPLTDDQRLAKTVGTYGGLGLLCASVAIFSSSIALWAFDPSTGKMRFTIEGD